MPEDGDKFTNEQAMEIGPENWQEVAGQYEGEPEWSISNDWHSGLYEDRSKAWGYDDGMPVYAGINIAGNKYHVYWIKNQDLIWLDPTLR